MLLRYLAPTFLLAASLGAQTKVVLLGTGTPNADPDRSGPCTAVVVNGSAYLVDFGPGVVRRASAAARRGLVALDARNLKTAFVTHLHSDHTAGYADLILTPAVLERDAPLAVYGPRGLKQMTSHILAAYKEDIRIRLTGGEPSKPRGYVVNAHEVRPGVVYQDANVIVEAFAVKHGAWEQAFGYKFKTADRTVVISGDAAPGSGIEQQCNGCDVLVHEVYSQAGFVKREPAWQRYHARYHTSTLQLAEIAGKAKPGLLVLTHELIWSSSPEEMLREIWSGYQGRVVFGNDLDVF